MMSTSPNTADEADNHPQHLSPEHIAVQEVARSGLGGAEGPDQPEAPPSLTFGQALTVAFLVSTLVMVIALAGYHTAFGRESKRPIATVDLAQIMQIKELVFNDLLTRPNATDADRAKAYDLIKGLSLDITKSVDELRSDCGCQILVKAAVVGDAELDLTEALKVKLGIASITPEELQRRVRAQAFSRGADDLKASPLARDLGPSHSDSTGGQP